MRASKALCLMALSWASSSSPALHAETVSMTLPGGIGISATEEKFVATGHTLTGCRQAYAKCVIDAVPAVGTIHVPETVLTDITVRVGKISFRLETSGMYNPLLGPSSEKRFGAFCYDANNCTIRAVLGDAGVTYVAEWIIENGVQRRSLLSDSGDLINFVSRNLTPPHYE